MPTLDFVFAGLAAILFVLLVASQRAMARKRKSIIALEARMEQIQRDKHRLIEAIRTEAGLAIEAAKARL